MLTTSTAIQSLCSVTGQEPPPPPATDLLRLDAICKDLSARHSPAAAADQQSGSEPIPVALSSPCIGTCVVVKVPINGLAGFLDDAGKQTKSAGLNDMQAWLQNRSFPNNELNVQHHGIIISVDEHHADFLQVFADAGLPLPNVTYQTTRGHRALFVFGKPVDKRTFEVIGKKLVLNIEGADSASWESTQGQHLPSCLQSVRGQKVDVDFPAIQVHANLLNTAAFLSEITPKFREIIAPGSASSPEERLDPVFDLKVTWATIEYLDQQFRKAFADEPRANVLVEAAIEVWLAAQANCEVELWIQAATAAGAENPTPPTPADFLALYRERLHGIDGAGAFRLMYDIDAKRLRLLTTEGATSLLAKGESLSLLAHYHEVTSTAAYTIGGIPVPAVIVCTQAVSLFNKALIGHTGCLRELGVPKIQRYEHPVSFVNEGFAVDPKTKIITAIQTGKIGKADPTFDVVEYFLGLFRAGQLPLASESDVRRYLMAIAAPFLRHTAPGLFGVVWFTGTTGAGKDFMCEMVSAIWQAGSSGRAATKFDLNCHNDLELKRSISQATNAVYCRVKEAGKRPDLVNHLIRLATTDVISARAMRQDEFLMANRFVYLVDSLENLPTRKEVSRRTVVVEVARVMGAKVNLGALHAEVLSHSADIIASLKRMVESHPQEWYLQHENVGLRPVGQVALADLFDVDLPEVAGRNLDDLFDAFFQYVARPDLADEGETNRRNARLKDGKEMGTCRSYRLAHFRDVMKTVDGFGQLFHDFPSAKSVELALQRELDYADVARGRVPYVRVEHGGRAYAFKLVRENRNFILEPELKFCDAMGITPIGPVAAEAGDSLCQAEDSVPRARTSARKGLRSQQGRHKP
ncbi:MAG: hypothetical protein ABSF35_21010 [Polyangia bacterium]|jgi:hypothetical protein